MIVHRRREPVVGVTQQTASRGVFLFARINSVAGF